MNSSRFLAWTALVAGLAAVVPASASAQIGGLIKKKVKDTVGQTVAGPDAAAANPAAPGPVFNEHVLAITPELLDRLEKALVAEAATREENDRRVGKVLDAEEYERCRQRVAMSAKTQEIMEEHLRVLGDETSTQQQRERALQEMATRLEALTEPECGLEPNKAEKLRSELAPRVAAAAEQASGLTDIQLSILKERILPFCVAPEAVAAAAGELRLPGETNTAFYVYSPTEVEALQPRCGGLLEALTAGD